MTQCLLGQLDRFLLLCHTIDSRLPWFTSLLGRAYELLWWCLQVAMRRSSSAHRFWTGIDCGVA